MKTGEQLKLEGIERAAAVRQRELQQARDYAEYIAKVSGHVTADDVARVFDLGPAAGALFRDRRFKWTGEWVQSSRPRNHTRLLRVWKLA
jgi:hypothetical protein